MTSNPELSYLLGMICGNGNIARGNNQTDVLIELPHKTLISEGMDARLSVRASLNDIRDAIEPLIGARINTIQQKQRTTLKFTKNNEDFLIREINRHYQNLYSCRHFRIPRDIMTSSTDIKREFMIGLSDVTAYMRRSNVGFGIPYHHRVYIEIPQNWFLVIDIGNLLLGLDVPIHTIDWGHPNMRDPNLVDYNLGKNDTWFREHQIKIFADEFEKIGFRVEHKMHALEELSNMNKNEWDRAVQNNIKNARSLRQKEKSKQLLGHIERVHHKYYWETGTRNIQKAIHPMENSKNIPKLIRGQHFNSWKKIAEALGYHDSKNK